MKIKISCSQWEGLGLGIKVVFSSLDGTYIKLSQVDYPRSTLANSTLIILFFEIFKIFKIISSNSKNIVKDNSEYLGIFHLLKWMFQKLIN